MNHVLLCELETVAYEVQRCLPVAAPKRLCYAISIAYALSNGEDVVRLLTSKRVHRRLTASLTRAVDVPSLIFGVHAKSERIRFNSGPEWSHLRDATSVVPNRLIDLATGERGSLVPLFLALCSASPVGSITRLVGSMQRNEIRKVENACRTLSESGLDAPFVVLCVESAAVACL